MHYNKGMPVNYSNCSQQDMLEIATVLQNLKETIAKSNKTTQPPVIADVFLKADNRNPDNEYYELLQPYLDYIDYEEGIEVDGMNVNLSYIEEKVLKILREEKIFGGDFITKTKKVPDPVGFGVLVDEPVLYHMIVYVDRFNEIYKQIIDLVEIEAALSFVRINTPVITVDNKSYELNTMREGHAFEIVELCLTKYPSKLVVLKTLCDDLGINGGLTNINEALKNSYFDKKKGLLRLFVTSSPKSIMVQPIVSMPKNHFQAIKQNSKK